jgi:hypothetical protein
LQTKEDALTDGDDELFARLRSDLVPAGDLDAARIGAIHDRAHAAMRARAPSARTIGRALESLAIAGIAVAQLVWAWSVVLRTK